MWSRHYGVRPGRDMAWLGRDARADTRLGSSPWRPAMAREEGSSADEWVRAIEAKLRLGEAMAEREREGSGVAESGRKIVENTYPSMEFIGK